MILLIITVILFKILFNNFGLLSTENKKERDDAIENFINNLSSKTNTVKAKKPFENIYSSCARKMKNVSNEKKDKTVDNFNEGAFIKSAEKAVVMILDAFSQKRTEILEKMLTENMLNIFKKNIQEAEINNFSYKTVVISFNEPIILDKNMDGTAENKTIKIRFLMKQINYIEDNDGNVLSGSKDKIESVSEDWTFIQQNTEIKTWLLKSVE
jgi:predicted lipid-binding transport protein (Tim44 family)